jgi:hypothetical protein
VSDGTGRLGFVLPVLLVLLAAGMALSIAAATTAAMTLAMSERSAGRLRALEAAEAGLAAALRAGGWGPAEAWTGAGSLPAGGRWQATVRLVAAQIDPLGGPVHWRFEIESAGEDGAARALLLQGFEVAGALPGEPVLTWWRQGEPEP